MEQKLKILENHLARLPLFAVAFSGGVDSTFLLAVAKKVVASNVLAIGVASKFVPRKEVEEAKRTADSIGVEYICLEADILDNKDVIQNTPERCYFCKKQVFLLVMKAARKRGVTTLLHGVNIDDLGDFRPGLKAAEELGFLSPMVDAGLNKSDIRSLSRKMGLATWDKPSQSCLATRIPYHDVITAQKLGWIDAAEEVLHTMGFAQVRVRCHGKMARLEVEPHMIGLAMEDRNRKKISNALRQIGFKMISIDIDGYKTGKMNDEIVTGTEPVV